MNIDLWPLLAYTVIVIVLIAGLLVASTFLGQKRKDHATHDVYESGVVPTGTPHIKIAVPFYLTAILFIIFDLEAAFLFAWAISIREAGWLGFVEVSVFIIILVAGLVYLWRSRILRFLRLFMPDVAWVTTLGGSFALVWSFLRTGLLLQVLRKFKASCLRVDSNPAHSFLEGNECPK